MVIDIKKIIDKIISKNGFVIFSILYCTLKSITYTQNISIFTYILTFYGIIVFIKTRLLHPRELLFEDYIFSYGIIAITILSTVINEIVNAHQFIIDMIPLCLNLCVLMPDYSNDNINSITKNFNFYSKYLLIATFLINILNVISGIIYLTNIDFNDKITWGTFRLLGVMGNPNLVGWFSLIGIGISLYLIKNFDDNHKFYNLVIKINFVISILSLFWSFCRGSILSFVIALPFILLMNNSIYSFFTLNKIKYFVIFIMCFIILFLALYLLFGRMGSGREEIYKFTFREYLSHNKLIGVGINKIKTIWANDYNMWMNQGDYIVKPSEHILNANPHNVFIFFLCIDGLIGFLLCIYLVIKLITSIMIMIFKKEFFFLKHKSIYCILVYFVLCGLTTGMVDNCILISQTLFINLLFCIAAGNILTIFRSKQFKEVEIK